MKKYKIRQFGFLWWALRIGYALTVTFSFTQLLA